LNPKDGGKLRLSARICIVIAGLLVVGTFGSVDARKAKYSRVKAFVPEQIPQGLKPEFIWRPLWQRWKRCATQNRSFFAAFEIVPFQRGWHELCQKQVYTF
jgi:hypothetical protein